MKNLIKELKTFFEKNKTKMEELNQYIDIEAELLAQFCDEYIEKLKQ